MNHKRLFHIPRTAAIISLSSLLVFALIFTITINSGLIPGVNSEVDEQEGVLIRDATMKVTQEGQFVDRNGGMITQAKEVGARAEILFDESYSYLIGFRTKRGEVSGLRATRYADIFFGGEDNVGATVQLTTDNGLQEHCYRVLDQREGSVIVMDAQTGALLACTARASSEMGYDADKYNENFNTYKNYTAFFMNRAIMDEDPPGSTFKIITAAAMIENGMSDYIYDDTTGIYTVDGQDIHNFGGSIHGKGITLEKALNKSTNVYFASAAAAMSGNALQNTAQKFLVGESIPLDFCTLHSNFDLGNTNSKGLRAQTGFGQGNTVMSPLHVAMVMAAVVNDGKIMQPYLIEQVTDDGRVRQTHTPTVLSEAIRPETARTLKSYLHSTAEKTYGYTEDKYGMVYAKTGTADQADGGNHIYMLLGLETETNAYVILIDSWNVSKTSSDLINPAGSIIDYLLTM